jgi:hypothetical protein
MAFPPGGISQYNFVTNIFALLNIVVSLTCTAYMMASFIEAEIDVRTPSVPIVIGTNPDGGSGEMINTKLFYET